MKVTMMIMIITVAMEILVAMAVCDVDNAAMAGLLIATNYVMAVAIRLSLIKAVMSLALL